MQQSLQEGGVGRNVNSMMDLQEKLKMIQSREANEAGLETLFKKQCCELLNIPITIKHTGSDASPGPVPELSVAAQRGKSLGSL